MYEEAVMDEDGWVKIPSAIRMRTGLLKKADIVVTSYNDKVIVVRRASDGKLEDMIKNTQDELRFEELFNAMHAKNLDVTDEEIAEEIREHRRTKRKAG